MFKENSKLREVKDTTTKVRKHHDKSLKTPRQKFEDAAANVSKRHGGSKIVWSGSEQHSRQSHLLCSPYAKWRTELTETLGLITHGTAMGMTNSSPLAFLFIPVSTGGAEKYYGCM